MSEVKKKRVAHPMQALAQRAWFAAAAKLRENHPDEWERLVLHERRIRGLPADSFEMQRQAQIESLTKQIAARQEKLEKLLAEHKQNSGVNIIFHEEENAGN